jgi:N-acetylmuramoyl-L-alanine amidase
MGENSMNIIQKFLTVNQFSRPGRRLAECRAVILHYVGIPGQRALTVWNYFEIDCPRKPKHSSAHYIIDHNGDIYHAVPDNEVAFHCGSTKYTDWARRTFGHFVSDPTKNSPNNCTIGIELCIDRQGNFTPETIISTVALVAKLLTENNLTTEDIGHHNLVVGWKDCPLPWVKEPDLFEQFKGKVREKFGVLI